MNTRQRGGKGGGQDSHGARRVALAGGGTGGHVYPALAMGEALARRGHEIVYFGDPGRLEGRVVPERGIPFVPVPAAQYPRAGLVAKARFGLALLGSVWRARGLLKKHDVNFVLGVGGYISAPPILAAWTLGIPTAVHEANVTPGMANKLCARVADLVLLTYEKTGPRLPGNAPRQVVGCPIHPGVLAGDRAQALKRYGLSADLPVLGVVGGSLGAATINDLGVALAGSAQGRFQVLLITGPGYHDDVLRRLDPIPTGVTVIDYERRMVDAYAAADLVLCRAGSSTLAELTAIGKPSVLVPSPNVTENHQEGNARGLEDVGAAVVITENELDTAVEQVRRLLLDGAALGAMAQAAKGQGRPGTAETVADLVESLLAPTPPHDEPPGHTLMA